MAKKTAQIRPEVDLDLLSETQHRAANLLACGSTYRAVADRLGLNPSTLSEWRKQPSFRAKINEILLDAQESTKRRLVAASAIALDTLLQVCQDQNASPRDRISAAGKILDLTVPTPMNPGPTNVQEIEAKDQENQKWDELSKIISCF